MDVFYVLLYVLTIYMSVEVIVSNGLIDEARQAGLRRVNQLIYVSFALILPLIAWCLI